MSTDRIPAKDIITCDRCGLKGERGVSGGAFYYGGLHVREAEFWGRSMGGDAGGYRVDYDFCSDCAHNFQEWMMNREQPQTTA